MGKFFTHKINEVILLDGETATKPGEATFETASDTRGPKFWAELHSYPWRLVGWDAASAAVFYEEWLERAGVQFGGCCNGSIERLKVIQPIGPGALESPFTFFGFGWAVHNTINTELGRQAFGFEAALNQWKPGD